MTAQGGQHASGAAALRRRLAELEARCDQLQATARALEEKESQYRHGELMHWLVVENAALIITVVDANCRVVFLNAYAADWMGGAVEQLTGKDFWEIFPKAAADNHATVIQRVVGEGRAHERESWTIIGGRRRLFRSNNRPLKDAQGRTTAVLSITEDITDQRQTQQALRESEDRFRRFFEDAAVGMSIIAEGRRYVKVNRAFAAMLGYSEAEMVGMAVEDITYPPDRAEDRELLGQVDSGLTKEYRLEKRYVAKDGRIVWVNISGSFIRDADGQAPYAVVVVEDTTERKRAQESLQESEAAAGAMLNATQDRALLLDPQGVILALNDTAARAFGQEASALVGRCVYDLMDPEPGARRKRLLTEVVRLGRPIRFEDVRDGRLLDSHVYPIFDGQGRVTRLGVFARDITEQRLAEDALRESEERFRTIFESGPVGMVLVDQEGRLLRPNSEFCQMLGYAPEELAPLTVLDITDALDRQATQDNLRRVVAGQAAVGRLQKRYLHKDGHVVWGDVAATLMRDSSGRAQYCLAIVQDISARKQAEEALRAREAQYRQIVEDQTELICRFRPDSTITFVNEAYCRCFGRTREQLVGQSFLPLIPEPNRTETQQRIASLSAASPTITNEHRVIAEGGEIRWQQWTNRAIFDQRGRIVEYQATGRDITERRQAEEALRESEHRLRMILQHSSDGIDIAILDRNTGKRRLVLCNDRYVQMSGRSREELMAADDLRPLVRLHATPEELESYVQACRNRQPYRGTASWIRPDGKENYYEWTAAPVELAPNVYMLIGVDRDVTQRRQAEEGMRALHRQLMTAREEERRGLASELHDSIGQGLVALQLALRGLADESKQASLALAEAISRLSWQCDGLIGEVRRVCHGLYPPTLESLGLAAALRQLARDFGDGRQVHVRFSPGDLAAAAGAPPRFSPEVEIALFRVAQEAIANAVRHGRASRVTIDLDCASGQAVLKVTDNGVGFHPHQVLEPTAQAAAAADPGGETSPLGTPARGMGLRTMQERAQAVGGSLTISSRPGRTCITVRVPFSPPASTTGQGGQDP